MTTKAFEKAFNHTVGVEGGYSDHPSDRGGKTMYGITEEVARAYGYTGDMRKLPLSTAKDIYNKKYWNKLRLDDISKLSESLACKLFDISVNMGQARAGLFLQIALNSFNKQGTLYPDIVEDGDVGPTTLKTLQTYYDKRGTQAQRVIFECVNCLQGAYYIEISKTRQANEDFTFGWFANRID